MGDAYRASRQVKPSIHYLLRGDAWRGGLGPRCVLRRRNVVSRGQAIRAHMFTTQRHALWSGSQPCLDVDHPDRPE